MPSAFFSKGTRAFISSVESLDKSIWAFGGCCTAIAPKLDALAAFSENAAPQRST